MFFKFVYLILFFNTTLLVTAPDIFIVHVENSSSNTTEIINNSNSNKCPSYFGNSLKECLQSLDNKEWQENFIKLSTNAQRNYLIALTRSEHKQLLKQLTPTEWQEIVKNVKSPLKEQLPQTIAEFDTLLMQENTGLPH